MKDKNLFRLELTSTVISDIPLLKKQIQKIIEDIET